MRRHTQLSFLLLASVSIIVAPSPADAQIFPLRCHHRYQFYSQQVTTPAGRSEARDEATQQADSPALQRRIAELEAKMSALEKRLNARQDKIETTMEKLSDRQEKTFGTLEDRIEENNRLLADNVELILVNAREVRRLVRLTSLAPDFEVKEAPPEDRRIYAEPIDVLDPPSDAVILDVTYKVRVFSTKKIGETDYSRIQYVNRLSGELSGKRYIKTDVLRALYQ